MRPNGFDHRVPQHGRASGTALVDPRAITQKCNNCEDFCNAAGEVMNMITVHIMIIYNEPTMFAVTGLGYGEIGNCRGDKEDSYKGAVA